MNSLFYCFLAACCACLSSLFFRKNNDQASSSSGYLIVFYFLSFILAFVIDPAIWQTKLNLIILAMGACVGVFSSTLMLMISKALKQGPIALTFAFLSASAIFPGMILFLILGPEFGFTCSYLQFGGMLCVLFGLFLGARKECHQSKASLKWLKYALACLLIQVLALTFIQARCLLFDANLGLLPIEYAFSEADDVWFLPGQFGASLIMQAVLFLKDSKKVQLSEVMYGSLGGIANFASSCLLLLATKWALPFEKGILFPCFAVCGMILCNMWANRLYKEKFNLKTNVLCSFGIFMAVAS